MASLLKRLFTGLVLFALVACEHQITAYTPQPALVHKATTNYAYTAMVWLDDIDAMPAKCKKSGAVRYACAESVFVNGIGSCTIWAVQPKDFNDVPGLAYLGHEFWHCMGANHG